MPVVYDKRRPRVPVELAREIDVARGQVPFDRWVREALEAALGNDGLRTPQGTDERTVTPSVPAPPRAPVAPPDVQARPVTSEKKREREPAPEDYPGIRMIAPRNRRW